MWKRVVNPATGQTYTHPEGLSDPGDNWLWLVCHADDGKEYYHNVARNVTSWELPEVLPEITTHEQGESPPSHGPSLTTEDAASSNNKQPEQLNDDEANNNTARALLPQPERSNDGNEANEVLASLPSAECEEVRKADARGSGASNESHSLHDVDEASSNDELVAHEKEKTAGLKERLAAARRARAEVEEKKAKRLLRTEAMVADVTDKVLAGLQQQEKDGDNMDTEHRRDSDASSVKLHTPTSIANFTPVADGGARLQPTSGAPETQPHRRVTKQQTCDLSSALHTRLSGLIAAPCADCGESRDQKDICPLTGLSHDTRPAPPAYRTASVREAELQANPEQPPAAISNAPDTMVLSESPPKQVPTESSTTFPNMSLAPSPQIRVSARTGNVGSPNVKKGTPLTASGQTAIAPMPQRNARATLNTATTESLQELLSQQSSPRRHTSAAPPCETKVSPNATLPASATATPGTRRGSQASLPTFPVLTELSCPGAQDDQQRPAHTLTDKELETQPSACTPGSETMLVIQKADSYNTSSSRDLQSLSARSREDCSYKTVYLLREGALHSAREPFRVMKGVSAGDLQRVLRTKLHIDPALPLIIKGMAGIAFDGEFSYETVVNCAEYSYAEGPKDFISFVRRILLDAYDTWHNYYTVVSRGSDTVLPSMVRGTFADVSLAPYAEPFLHYLGLVKLYELPERSTDEDALHALLSLTSDKRKLFDFGASTPSMKHDVQCTGKNSGSLLSAHNLAQALLAKFGTPTAVHKALSRDAATILPSAVRQVFDALSLSSYADSFLLSLEKAKAQLPSGASDADALRVLLSSQSPLPEEGISASSSVLDEPVFATPVDRHYFTPVGSPECSLVDEGVVWTESLQTAISPAKNALLGLHGTPTNVFRALSEGGDTVLPSLVRKAFDEVSLSKYGDGFLNLLYETKAGLPRGATDEDALRLLLSPKRADAGKSAPKPADSPNGSRLKFGDLCSRDPPTAPRRHFPKHEVSSRPPERQLPQSRQAEDRNASQGARRRTIKKSDATESPSLAQLQQRIRCSTPKRPASTQLRGSPRRTDPPLINSQSPKDSNRLESDSPLAPAVSIHRQRTPKGLKDSVMHAVQQRREKLRREHAARHSHHDPRLEVFTQALKASALSTSSEHADPSKPKSRTIFYNKETHYVGEAIVQSNKPYAIRHGQGRLVVMNAKKPNLAFDYEGDWDHNEATGQGLLKLTPGNASEYSGGFIKGNPAGPGVLEVNKISAEGGFDSSTATLNGPCRIAYPNGDVYTGMLKNNAPTIEGLVTHTNGDVYHWIWPEASTSGSGTCLLEYHTGDIYEGEVHAHLKHGSGRLAFASGDHYEGNFYKDMLSGEGVLELSTGVVYEGHFKNNLFHGQGKYTDPSGNVYTGSFKEGSKHGRGVMQYADGETWKGIWEYDARTTGSYENTVLG